MSERIYEDCNYVVTKHSWKGKYKRILSVSDGVRTINPSNLEITNRWEFPEVTAVIASKLNDTEFQITFKRKKRTENLKFSSEYRSFLLTSILKRIHATHPSKSINVQKHAWEKECKPVKLYITSYGVKEVHEYAHVVNTLNFSEIGAIFRLGSNEHSGFVLKEKLYGTMHLYLCDNAETVIEKICASACENIGISLGIETTSFSSYLSNKYGIYSSDAHITSSIEFMVHHIMNNGGDKNKRNMCFSESCIIIRDLESYNILSLHPFSEIFSLIRYEDNCQMFGVHYVNGEMQSFLSNDRDSLLASLLDFSRACGNSDIHVRISPLDTRLRHGPLRHYVEEDVELSHLKFLLHPPSDWKFEELIRRFNANIPYTGLHMNVIQENIFSDNKEKIIQGVLSTLLSRNTMEDYFYEEFQAIRRLISSKHGFSSFTSIAHMREKLGQKVMIALKCGNEGICYAAIEMLSALIRPTHIVIDLRQEQQNKKCLLSSESFNTALITLWVNHIARGTASLLVASMLDFFTFCLCHPFSETTDGKQFDSLLEKISEHGKTIFVLFEHPSLTIVKGAGLVVKALIEEGTPEISLKMQRLALTEGSILIHLTRALYSDQTNKTIMLNCQLSQKLLALWISEDNEGLRLFFQVMPEGLIAFLFSDEKLQIETEDLINCRNNLKIAEQNIEDSKTSFPFSGKDSNVIRTILQKSSIQSLGSGNKPYNLMFQHWHQKMMNHLGSNEIPKPNDRPIVLRKGRNSAIVQLNWSVFYDRFFKDHNTSKLIWNSQTRQELFRSLQLELERLKRLKESMQDKLISWNYNEFEVLYTPVKNEIIAGGFYLRQLLKESKTEIQDPLTVFNDVYHQFLLSSDSEVKGICLQSMTVLYKNYYEKIGVFKDIKHIVLMLEKTLDFAERDHLVLFLSSLIKNVSNIKDFIRYGGIEILADYLPLAHLQSSRVTHVYASEALKYDEENVVHEKSWYYAKGQNERVGPLGFKEMKDLYREGKITLKTKIWAAGFDNWVCFEQVPQFKWTTIAKNGPVLNETELVLVILNIFIEICKYFPSRDQENALICPQPKIKSIISNKKIIPHIVQLLVTFEPKIVEKVSFFFTLILKDDLDIQSFCTTGIFFFLLMYTGSNVMSLAELLHILMKYKKTDKRFSTGISIIEQILPEAMTLYLENYGPTRFSEIFLGEYNNPEVVWNKSMRQFMIQKLALHISDFIPKLKSNIKTVYEYLPIQKVRYENLENELFCHTYYLRNLCDEKFSDWIISEPYNLLKDVIGTWKRLMRKEPAKKKYLASLKVLDLKEEDLQKNANNNLRKSYFKLAQKYHPDKNPDGRTQFEEINDAYHFLCSNSLTEMDKQTNTNIKLILRTQSLLYNRFPDDLSPFTYPCYPELVKIIIQDADREDLFSCNDAFLADCCECVFQTIRFSSNNVLEFQGENGIRALYLANERCIPLINSSICEEEFSAQICLFTIKSFTIMAVESVCTESMKDLSSLEHNFCRILSLENLSSMRAATIECILQMTSCGFLRRKIIDSGTLCHLLIIMLKYDFTLCDTGIDMEIEKNTQAKANDLAEKACLSCLRLVFSDDNETDNRETKEYMTTLLTPYIIGALKNGNIIEVLKILTSNVRNPLILWNNQTRGELQSYLENRIRQSQKEESFLATLKDFNFSYSSFDEELIIGGIFVDIYNEMPSFNIEEAEIWAKELLSTLHEETRKSLFSAEEVQDCDIVKCEKVILALSNLLANSKELAPFFNGHMESLFNILVSKKLPSLNEGCLGIVHQLAKNEVCIQSMLNFDVIRIVFLFYYHHTDSAKTVLSTLVSLLSDNRSIKDFYTYGGMLPILQIFSSKGEERQKASELMNIALSNKLMGQKFVIYLQKYLPYPVIDSIKQNPKGACSFFDTNHENPELLWNTKKKEKLERKLSEMIQNHVSFISNKEKNKVWSEIDTTVSCDSPDELVVSGVYVTLYNDTPNYTITNPKPFLMGLMESILVNDKSGPRSGKKILSTALIKLLQTQTYIADILPATGYVPLLVKSLKDQMIAEDCLKILNEISRSRKCIEVMSSIKDCVNSLLSVLNAHEGMTDDVCLITDKLFESADDALVEQAIKCGLIEKFLSILSSETHPKSPSTTSYIINSLHKLQECPKYKEQVEKILAESDTWHQYRTQNRDLFIEDSNTPMISSTNINYLMNSSN